MAGKAITMRSRAEEEADAQMKGAGGRQSAARHHSVRVEQCGRINLFVRL